MIDHNHIQKKIISLFSKDYFKYPRSAPMASGALLCKPSPPEDVTPEEVFEILDLAFGPPNLAIEGFTFIDDKTSWTWVFETPHGSLDCYDFKGGWSIGYRGESTEALRNDGQRLANEIITAVHALRTLEKEDEASQRDIAPFVNFLRSFGACRLLLQKAHDKGSLIEGVVLYAALLDGLLRISIILKEQINRKTEEIDETLITQKDKGGFFSERAIYRIALEKEIIDQDIFDELNDLYDKRNIIVHRFFLSSIQYADLPPVLLRFETLYQKLYEKVYALESKQIELGVGMTRGGSKSYPD
jgi:uncharacterized protein YutE (UPF0331/DUF86 family)